MREPDTRAAPRLRFTKDETQAKSIPDSSASLKKAVGKETKSKPVDSARAPLETKCKNAFPHGQKAEIREPLTEEETATPAEETIPTAQADTFLTVQNSQPSKTKLKTGQKKPLSSGLHFDELPAHRTKKSDIQTEKKKPVQAAAGILKPVGRAAKDEAETQLSKYEDDNIGLQAAHTAEETGSSALHMGRQVRELRKNRLRRKEEKALSASENGSSNPMSHRYQRRNIQKDYRATKAGKATGSASGKTGQTAVKRASSATEKAVEYVSKKKHLTVLLALGFLLIFTVQGLSACAPLLEAGITALTMGTYPAEEADVWAAEQYYAELEWELQNEMQRYELYHVGYDEYEVDAQEIWHDPYALIALIFAYNNGEEWTLDDAIPIMNMLFEWQYEKTETVTSAQKYYTEIVGGKETKVWHTVTTCTVTLKNKNLSHAPVYIMSREKVGLYALYMSTRGNMDGLFHGPHVSELTEPLKYDVPQELLDADPKLALLVEEANKRLGYPYVWGGYTPDTSFDCSGFISWIFTETGVRNIGHMGATGLYGISQHITEAQLKPGDVIFFSGTIEGETGITHCGLYVGNGMMVHCGSPCSYYDVAHGSLRDNICGYGRFYQH